MRILALSLVIVFSGCSFNPNASGLFGSLSLSTDDEPTPVKRTDLASLGVGDDDPADENNSSTFADFQSSETTPVDETGQTPSQCLRLHPKDLVLINTTRKLIFSYNIQNHCAGPMEGYIGFRLYLKSETDSHQILNQGYQGTMEGESERNPSSFVHDYISPGTYQAEVEVLLKTHQGDITIQNHLTTLSVEPSPGLCGTDSELEALAQIQTLATKPITHECEKGRIKQIDAQSVGLNTLPDVFENLPELTSLNVWGNNLTNLPPSLCFQGSKLRFFHLNSNPIATVPTQISNCTQLISLGLQNTPVSELPTFINDLPLQILNINGTAVSDISWLDLPNLKSFNAGRSNITALPTKLGEATALYSLYIGGTNISGSFPTVLQTFDLSRLDVSNLNLTGTLPETMNTTRLEHFYAGGNNFTGSIPDWLTNQQTMKLLWLNDNQFDGTMPNFTSPLLQTLRVENNQFKGPIPSIPSQLLGSCEVLPQAEGFCKAPGHQISAACDLTGIPDCPVEQ